MSLHLQTDVNFTFAQHKRISLNIFYVILTLIIYIIYIIFNISVFF